MSGARRHCPAVVTDTERDMSKELNTEERGREAGQGQASPGQGSPDLGEHSLLRDLQSTGNDGPEEGVAGPAH